MKTFAITWKSMFFIMACIMVFFVSCSKDNDDNPAGNNDQRIIAMTINFLDTIEIKEAIFYSGNLLTQIIVSDTISYDSSKYVYEYSGGKISHSTYYDKLDGAWIKQGTDEILGYNGYYPTGIHTIFYDDIGAVSSENKMLYTYAGTLLTKAEYYTNHSGTWDLSSTTNYVYDGQGRIIQETDTSTMWGYPYGNITTYKYDGGLLSESFYLFYSSGTVDTNSKCTYQYANNRLTGKTYYNWDFGNWTLASEWQYDYNDAGNLMKEWRTDGLWEFEYTYGQGTGNYRDCLKVFSTQYTLPGDPTPYPVKPVKTTPGSMYTYENHPGTMLR